MSLKIDVYSVMRNEIELLPYFLRHYETFATRIFVFEDGSDDGTLEMLQAHPKVTVLPCGFGLLDDVQFVKQLWPQYEKISRGHADWVMIADTDEFIYHPNMVAKLEELGKSGVKKVHCSGYTMYSDSFPTTTGQIYEEIKVGWPDRWSKKTTVFTPDIFIRWSHGRHHVIGGRHIPQMADTGINVLHYRFLGLDYFIRRNIKNCESMKIKYKMHVKHNLPDGTRGISHKWYQANRDKLKNVVDVYENVPGGNDGR